MKILKVKLPPKKHFLSQAPWLPTIATSLTVGVYITVFLFTRLSEIQKSIEEHNIMLKSHQLDIRIDSAKIIHPLFYFSKGIATLIGLKYEVKISNHSQEICYLSHMFTKDTSINIPLIRKDILSEDTAVRLKYGSDPDSLTPDTLFIPNVINPNSSIWLPVKIWFSYSSWYDAQTCYLHCLILYKNQRGGYYDIYFVQKMTFDGPKDLFYVDLKGKMYDGYINDSQEGMPIFETFKETNPLFPHSYDINQIEILKKNGWIE